jgi:hypothetical protein
VVEESALSAGIQTQPADVLAQFKEDLFVESTEIGFDEALLRKACTVDPEIEGAAVCEMPSGKEPNRI